MKITQIVLLGVFLLFPGLSRPVQAEGFSLQSLNPFGSREDDHPTQRAEHHSLVDVSRRTSQQGPSIWAKVNSDLRRLNNGTKRFLANTADALCWKKSSPPASSSRTSPYNRQNSSTPKKSESGWFTPFWGRQESQVPRSPEEFVGMERPKM
ncbi:MAG: hypothetical protein RBS80_09310 [Thermoguttaceae bacterium]|jgi:hypothetical protein|nr:hypothetical protein [Thermoguttaceae bacterium]